MQVVIGNESYVDALARKSVTTYSPDVADTSIETAGPEGNPSIININCWLAKEYEEHRFIQKQPNTAQSPTSRCWYLSNYHDALQAHMHPLHELRNANTVANYRENYQTLIKNGTANGAASNAYLTASYVPVKIKCIIMKYRTGTLYNTKACGTVSALNKPNSPPLPSTRQCPAYPVWMQTHANKQNDQ